MDLLTYLLIKHPVPAVICNFWHPGTLTLIRVPRCQKLQTTA